jgi:hypothetical protein
MTENSGQRIFRLLPMETSEVRKFRHPGEGRDLSNPTLDALSKHGKPLIAQRNLYRTTRLLP